MFWIGLVSTAILLTWISDKCGRRWVYTISLTVLLVVFTLILFQSKLIALYVLMFLVGATYGGRFIVQFNYFLEYWPMDRRNLLTFLRMFFGQANIIIITAII